MVSIIWSRLDGNQSGLDSNQSGQDNNRSEQDNIWSGLVNKWSGLDIIRLESTLKIKIVFMSVVVFAVILIIFL